MGGPVSERRDGSVMQLRPYQQAAVERARALLEASDARVLLVAPTAAGKTVMGNAIASGEDPLWLVPSTALREQTMGRAVTVQSLLGGARPQCSLLICDEAHHLAGGAEQWAAVAASYPRILGLTATPCRHDGAALGEQFNRLVVAAQYSELLREGYIVPCRVVRPINVPDDETGLAQHPVQAWHRYAKHRPGFAFFSRVTLADKFAQAIGEGSLFPTAALIHGEQPQDERDRKMASFRDGVTNVLASVQTLTEGVDVPHAEVCMLAVQPAHEGSYLQRVGRVLRPAPGKTEALLIDLPGASFRYGFPTDDREYSLAGDPVRRKGGAPALSQCLNCGAVYPAGPVCPECGWRRPEKVRPPRIWGVTMESVRPEDLSAENRAKLDWKRRMLADSEARLAWLRGRAKSAKHAWALHLSVFGQKMPHEWWGIFQAMSRSAKK